MKRNYKKIITLLNKLEEAWSDATELELFANNGFLFLINHETSEIISVFPNIDCDGGDCKTYFKKDKEYLDR